MWYKNVLPELSAEESSSPVLEYGCPSNQGHVLIMFPNPHVYNTQVVCIPPYGNSAVKTECTEERLRLYCLLPDQGFSSFLFPYTREERHSPVCSSLWKGFSTQRKGLQSAVGIKLLLYLQPRTDKSLL